jgi:hypothetical protein
MGCESLPPDRAPPPLSTEISQSQDSRILKRGGDKPYLESHFQIRKPEQAAAAAAGPHVLWFSTASGHTHTLATSRHTDRLTNRPIGQTTKRQTGNAKTTWRAQAQRTSMSPLTTTDPSNWSSAGRAGELEPHPSDIRILDGRRRCVGFCICLRAIFPYFLV